MRSSLTQLARMSRFARKIKRIFNTVSGTTELAPIADMTVEQKHAAINKDLQRCFAARLDGVISIAGIRIREFPKRVIETINEVIVRQDYEFYEGSRKLVLIDIGMNVAITTLLKASSPNYSRVYGFEPLKPTYDIARQNIDLNPSISNKIETFNIGLSNDDHVLNVKYTLDEIMSVSSEGTFDACFGQNTTTETIQIEKASRVLAPILLRHNDEDIFLKIDCEGAEFKIMADLEANHLLSKFNVIIIEWHNKSPADLLTILSRNGYFYFLEHINVEWNVGIIKAISIARASNVA